MDRGTTRKYALAGAALLLLILVSVCARVYVDWLWFRSLDFGSVFTTTLLSKLGVQSLVLAVTFLIIFINLIIARRYVIGNRPAEVNDEGRKIIYLETDYPWQRLLRTRASWWMLLAASVFIAFVVGAVGGINGLSYNNTSMRYLSVKLTRCLGRNSRSMCSISSFTSLPTGY